MSTSIVRQERMVRKVSKSGVFRFSLYSRMLTRYTGYFVIILIIIIIMGVVDCGKCRSQIN